MFSLPITRTSFLDSRFRLRNRANRLIASGHVVDDRQLDPVAHVGQPGAAADPHAPSTARGSQSA